MCVCVDFIMCGFCSVWVCVCVGVSVICPLVFTVFCTACTVCLYCLVYAYLCLFVLSLLVQGLLPPSDKSTALIKQLNK